VIISKVGEIFTGATYEDGINHAEIVALNKGTKAKGATLCDFRAVLSSRENSSMVYAIAEAGIEKLWSV
jgi:tRNA(Arg) A34 adenosine deaminase TadA